MLGLAFVAVGSFCRRSFAIANFVFALQALSSPAPMSFPHAGTSSEVTHPGASRSSPSLPSEGRVEGAGGFSGCPCVASRGSSSPPARLWSSRRGGRSCFLAADSCYPLCPGWLSLLISARPVRWWGGTVFVGLLCSRLPLPPHLCMPCEVMRRESLRSSAPVRVPPWLPDLRFGKPGGCFGPALGRIALVTGLVAHAVAPLSFHG